MTPILKKMTDRFTNGLTRSSVQSCSVWATQYRVMGKPDKGPYTFDKYPWTKEMHDSKAMWNVGMKSAQMGFTEMVLNVCFYAIDILAEDVLYVLPNAKPDAADFSKSRFDAAIELSNHLASLFSDVKNVGHKRAGAANMFIRGSGSKTGLKSISTPKIILDELEEMVQENIPLAFERASGQDEEDRCVWMISTPRIFNDGIHKQFQDTDQKHFMFRCPSCNRTTELTFPECFVAIGEDVNDPRIKESFYQCKDCHVKLEHKDKINFLSLKNGAHWEATIKDRYRSGWQIPQMYSFKITPNDFAESYFKGLKDPTAETEFYNSKLGVPHEVKDARVKFEQIQDCQGEFGMQDQNARGFVTMGVDVGRVLHVVITTWTFYQGTNKDVNANAHSRLLLATTVDTFGELDGLLNRFNVKFCVIDANPERHAAEEFAKRNHKRVAQCFYGNDIMGNTIVQNLEELTIRADRTTWLDTCLSRFRNKTTSLPVDIPKDFKEHINNQVRIYEKNKFGENVARYKSTGDDHYGHAWNYNEIALPLAFSITAPSDIKVRVV